mmetsp:Transcript_79486/g.199834  ORF Transcript_79486/g.199834 Transcript_79486/m.199834 type:complete len:360 (+) Transcript_79486:50-1129(+)
MYQAWPARRAPCELVASSLPGVVTAVAAKPAITSSAVAPAVIYQAPGKRVVLTRDSLGASGAGAHGAQGAPPARAVALTGAAGSRPDDVLSLTKPSSCCAEQDEALAHSEHQVIVLSDMLQVAKSEMECLGEEADKECNALRSQLQRKQEELERATAELESLAKRSYMEDLRNDLSESRSLCAELREELSAERHACSIATHGHLSADIEDSMRGKLERYESERAALATEAATLADEARELHDMEEEAWSNRSLAFEQLSADVARMQRSVLEEHGDASFHFRGHGAHAGGNEEQPAAYRSKEGYLRSELAAANALSASYCNEVTALRQSLAEAEETIGMLTVQGAQILAGSSRALSGHSV